MISKSKFLILAVVLSIIGCSSEKEKQIEYPADYLYNQAETLVNDKKIDQALKQFAEVERQHPQSEYAKKAIARSAEVAYLNGRYEQAIASAKDFLSNNPNHQLSPKVSFILAMCYYDQISDINREQSMSDSALKGFNDVILNYPATDYAISSKFKIDIVKDHLAGKELDVGRYYLFNGNYDAAINRFSIVVNEYSSTSQVPEALARLVEAYLALGLVDQAKQTAAILSYNHNKNKWYKYAYNLLNSFKK